MESLQREFECSLCCTTWFNAQFYKAVKQNILLSKLLSSANLMLFCWLIFLPFFLKQIFWVCALLAKFEKGPPKNVAHCQACYYYIYCLYCAPGNEIGEAGLKSILLAVQYQITLANLAPNPALKGLMRLSLGVSWLSKLHLKWLDLCLPMFFWSAFCLKILSGLSFLS